MSALTVVEVEHGVGANVLDEVLHHQGIKTDGYRETILQADLQTPLVIVAIATRLRIVCC